MEGITKRIPRIRSNSPSVTTSSLSDGTEDIKSVFWQEWQAHRDYFYRCCLKWTNYNAIDAEDILSQAMLKACNEWQNYEGKIKYPKAWLTQIIYNFSMDIHRKRKREAQIIENIDDIELPEHSELACQVELTESNRLDLEMRKYLDYQIESLPTRLRTPFVLHYCQDKSYQDIAKQFACSEDNVRKSVRKARIILQKHLNKYLAGEDNTSLDSPSSSLNLGIYLPEKSPPESNWSSPITTKSQHEEINYKTTVICRETLPHHWCNSASLLGYR